MCLSSGYDTKIPLFDTMFNTSIREKHEPIYLAPKDALTLKHIRYKDIKTHTLTGDLTIT